MQALREIGFGKACKYGFFELAMVVYRGLLFPQLRTPFLRLLGATIGSQSIVHGPRFFNLYRTGISGLTIGASCFVGDECLFDLAERITMADHATVSERVIILTHTNVGYRNHPLQPYLPSMSAPVHLDSGCFVGANATILPGVRIGACSIVAAGAVVTEDVPPWHVVGGVPARVLKSIKSDVHVETAAAAFSDSSHRLAQN
ncbi:MAG: acyltransferase [Vicinamibacterales bacterium]